VGLDYIHSTPLKLLVKSLNKVHSPMNKQITVSQPVLTTTHEVDSFVFVIHQNCGDD
jgi:hypothetical protein